MSKKQKQLEAQTQEEVSKKQDEISQGVIETESKKQDKKSKDVKDKKKDKKKKEKGSKIVKKTKETVSELKKVTWPSFGEVVKKTSVVIAFVIIFGLFLFGVNTLLGWLVGLLVGWLGINLHYTKIWKFSVYLRSYQYGTFKRT